MDILSAEGLSHPTRSLSRIVAEGRGNLNAVQTLFGLISSTILDLVNVTISYRKEVARKSRYS
jgi:hypothetical protein